MSAGTMATIITLHCHSDGHSESWTEINYWYDSVPRFPAVGSQECCLMNTTIPWTSPRRTHHPGSKHWRTLLSPRPRYRGKRNASGYLYETRQASKLSHSKKKKRTLKRHLNKLSLAEILQWEDTGRFLLSELCNIANLAYMSDWELCADVGRRTKQKYFYCNYTFPRYLIFAIIILMFISPEEIKFMTVLTRSAARWRQQDPLPQSRQAAPRNT